MKRNHMHFGTTLGSVLLAVLMLVAVSPVASAAGPLFHNWSYPEFRLQTVLPEPTIEGLAEANAYETLLEKYDGFGVETFANSAYVDADSYSFFYGTKAFDFFCNAGDSEEQPRHGNPFCRGQRRRHADTCSGRARSGYIPGGWNGEHLWRNSAG